MGIFLKKCEDYDALISNKIESKLSRYLSRSKENWKLRILGWASKRSDQKKPRISKKWKGINLDEKTIVFIFSSKLRNN